MRFVKSSYREIQQFQGRPWIIPDRLENTQAAFTSHGIPGHLKNTHMRTKLRKADPREAGRSPQKGRLGICVSDGVPPDSPTVSTHKVSPSDRTP